jgi:hypothetical protein
MKRLLNRLLPADRVQPGVFRGGLIHPERLPSSQEPKRRSSQRPGLGSGNAVL